jgi:surface protein
MPNINPINISNGTPSPEGWQRPDDWLAMPTVVDTDQTFVGLHAVHEVGQNYCAFRFTTSSGQYEVDWGDGTTTLHNSNTTAEHEYDYATYDTAGDTLSTRGYKQAIIVVTPVSGNLTSCNFQFRYITSPAQNQAYATGFLDCILSMPNATTGQSVIFGGQIVIHRRVERVNILTIGGVTNIANIFRECASLQSVPLFDTSGVIDISIMFNNCTSLQSVPLFDTSSVTNILSMFQGCVSLQTVPLFNTSNVTNMGGMFNGCNSLQSVPLFDTSSVTNMSSMFASCTSLQSVPLFDTSSVTNMSSMFASCTSLQSVPLFDTSSVINMGSMFNLCRTIKEIPAFNTSSNSSTFTIFAQQGHSLTKTDMVFNLTVRFDNSQLSREAIVNIFNNLTDRTGLTAQNITISGNWGASALTTGERDIALNKNWTITG